MFVFVSLFLTLTACKREPVLSPDNSSSSSSVSINLTTDQTAAVNAVIASKYAGYSIKEAQKEVEDGIVYYKVTIVSGDNKIRLMFNSSWQFIGEKK